MKPVENPFQPNYEDIQMDIKSVQMVFQNKLVLVISLSNLLVISLANIPQENNESNSQTKQYQVASIE